MQMRTFVLPFAAMIAAAGPSRVLGAQNAADGPILAARHVVNASTFKIFNSRGSVRVVGRWPLGRAVCGRGFRRAPAAR